MHTYIPSFTFIMFFWKIFPASLSEIPLLSTIPEWCNMNTLPHTTGLLLQACAHVLVCFYEQHIEESNVAEMLWWWLTQFKLVGKVTTGLSDFFTVPAKRIEGTTRADQQTYGEKRKQTFIQAIAISLNTGCPWGIKVSHFHLGISEKKNLFF